MKPETMAVLESVLPSYPSHAPWQPHDPDRETGSVVIYALMLRHIPDARILTALQHWIKTPDRDSHGNIKTKFRPTPDVLIAIDEDLTFPDRPTPGAAWQECCRLRRDVGQYRTPAFSSPEVALTVEYMGGWKMFCTANEEDRPIERAQFERRFGEAALACKIRHDRDLAAALTGSLTKSLPGSLRGAHIHKERAN